MQSQRSVHWRMIASCLPGVLHFARHFSPDSVESTKANVDESSIAFSHYSDSELSVTNRTVTRRK